MKRGRGLLLLSLAAALLCACGGGGGGGSASTPSANRAPTARISAPESASAGEAVTLDGSASSDPDGSIASWSWEQLAGAPVALEAPDEPRARFIAPTIADPTTLEFELTVTDDDGATASARVAIDAVPGPSVRLSGRVLLPGSQGRDSDTNDPQNLTVANDTPETAQPIGNPFLLGGYVNEAGAGSEGSSRDTGDVDDYFSVELVRGQVLSLLVAQPREGDADLYLLDAAGSVIDFSVDTDELEELVVPENGRYLVNVTAFSGATNYTLVIGSGEAAPLRRPPLIAGDLVVRLREGAITRAGPEPMAGYGLQRLAGATGREQLMHFDPAPGQGPTPLAVEASRRLGTAASRRARFRDPGLAAEWETLITIKTLRQDKRVADVSANWWVRPLAEVNDPAFEFQWHYPLINLSAAWASTTGDPSTIVAVVDTGILADHPDIRGQLVDGYDFVRDPAIAGDGDGIDPDPTEEVIPGEPSPSFHGTHVAGTVAAATNNGIGVAGVAYGARVMPLRGLGADGGSSFDVLQAVRYAAGLENDAGRVPAETASVINLSLGGSGFSSVSENLYRQLRDSGIIVVAAAGNESSTSPSYPAAYEGVFSVSAVDARRRLASYSNRGSTIDLAAPGGDGSQDVNADGYPDGVLSLGRADGDFAYVFISGTSMAAPHVAGVFALMKTLNPALTAFDLQQFLAEGRLTDDLGAPGRDDLYGHGLIDAGQAIATALASIGQEATAEARLQASASALNFGSGIGSLDLELSRSGTGPLEVLELRTGAAWLSARAVAVDGEGLGVYELSVDRSSLAPGVYAADVEILSTVNRLSLRALATVQDSGVSDLGTIYLLLYDPEVDATVTQTTVSRERNNYRFELEAPMGRYQIFAGTDMDNDLLVCDEGEACGAYLTLEEPATIATDAAAEDLDFTVEFLIALPGSSPSAAGVARQEKERDGVERRPPP